jgi:hypothetical protein
MDNKGEEFDLEFKTPEKGKVPPLRLVELACLLVITSYQNVIPITKKINGKNIIMIRILTYDIKIEEMSKHGE